MERLDVGVEESREGLDDGGVESTRHAVAERKVHAPLEAGLGALSGVDGQEAEDEEDDDQDHHHHGHLDVELRPA
ncbi:hypothetical protein Pyn_14193 [Prunus yedoensis var. nudiflora]|uniref:Uncharacterized protein n=1 Tax=Prunus yedoensis var. nudiflora TaxID=2094558 RepID=A0A314ULC7_PRUYE|nr:hypothetical protein Pyn_14193 [Prunus yedoensis var. nudiflora]